MVEFVCEQCMRSFYDEDLPRRGEICFGCHVKSVNLGFTYGKENFHGDTIGERQRKRNCDGKTPASTPSLEGCWSIWSLRLTIWTTSWIIT